MDLEARFCDSGWCEEYHCVSLRLRFKNFGQATRNSDFVNVDSAVQGEYIKVHEGVVEDVAWHIRNEHLFGSVGDDPYLFIWDLCDSSVTKPAQSVVAHQSVVSRTWPRTVLDI